MPRLSRYLHLVPLAAATVATHGVTGERIVLGPEVGDALAALRDTEFSAQDLSRLLPASDGAALLSFLESRALVVDRDHDEGEEIERLFSAAGPAPSLRDHQAGTMKGKRRQSFWQPSPIPADAFPAARSPAAPGDHRGDGHHGDGHAPHTAPLEPVKILALGGCVTEFARDQLVNEALRRGLDATVIGAWPDARHRLRNLVRDHEPDVTVVQLSILPYLTGLWDDGPLAGPGERRERTARLRAWLSAWISALAEATEGNGTGIIHNFAPSALSPYGRYEHAVEYNTRQVIAEVNGHIDEELRAHPHVMLLDEERLVARHGALTLFDDSVFPFGHHGGSLDTTLDRPNQLPALGAALAREYLDIHEAATRQGRIKCVVTDLDGTLWPGVAADDGFGWLDRDATGTWTHLGLHQALKLLKHRGLLLATCSKGTADHTLAAWRSAPHSSLLTPDDFVIHKISWSAKSASVAQIADELGFAPEALVFLDDNPVERYEVARALPSVHVVDTPVSAFRQHLLSSPWFDRRPGGGESSNRTETTRSMLARNALARQLTTDELVREVQATVTVRRAGTQDLPRVAELLERTNQYRTVPWRPDPADLRRRADRGSLYVCSVRDRFADYGLVGACALEERAVHCVAVSCRVIGLGAGPALLAVALRESGLAVPGTGAVFQATGRNEPAAGLFAETGFRLVAEDGGETRYTLSAAEDLVSPESLPQRIVVERSGDLTGRILGE